MDFHNYQMKGNRPSGIRALLSLIFAISGLASTIFWYMASPGIIFLLFGIGLVGASVFLARTQRTDIPNVPVSWANRDSGSNESIPPEKHE